MLGIATILFAVAALGGLTLATLHVRDKHRPWPLTVLHGLLAATALVLLLVEVLGGASGGMLTTALVLFVLAALGGFTLLSFRLRGRSLPNAGVVGHALFAVVAFVLLLLVVL